MKKHEGKSTRKPYNQDIGYVTMRGCENPRGTHIVVYDRNKGYAGAGALRFVVVHKPSEAYISFETDKAARIAMKDWASYGPDVVKHAKR